MTGLKSIVCLLLLVAVATAADLQVEQRSDEHNIDECIDDSVPLVLHKTIIVEGKFLQVQEVQLHFPDGSIPSPGVIKCIRVFDEIGNGNGGYPIITDGGLTFKTVAFRFTSQRSRGMKFSVSIYAQ